MADKHEIKRTRMDYEAGWEAVRDQIWQAYNGSEGEIRKELWELYVATGTDQRIESAEAYALEIHEAAA